MKNNICICLLHNFVTYQLDLCIKSNNRSNGSTESVKIKFSGCLIEAKKDDILGTDQGDKAKYQKVLKHASSLSLNTINQQ